MPVIAMKMALQRADQLCQERHGDAPCICGDRPDFQGPEFHAGFVTIDREQVPVHVWVDSDRRHRIRCTALPDVYDERGRTYSSDYDIPEIISLLIESRNEADTKDRDLGEMYRVIFELLDELPEHEVMMLAVNSEPGSLRGVLTTNAMEQPHRAGAKPDKQDTNR